MSQNTSKTRELTYTALAAAIVFVTTYLIRIPNPATGGYEHLGDCMIFLSVLLLGRKNGAIAGGIGGALSDLLAGAPHYIIPTFICKYGMAWIMGTIIKDRVSSAKAQIAGSVLGGLFQVAGYTLFKVFWYDPKIAVVSIPGNLIQTAFGIAGFFLVARALSAKRVGIIRRELNH